MYNLKRKFLISIILILTLFSLDVLLCLYIYKRFYYENIIFSISLYLLVFGFTYAFKSNKYSLIYSISVSVIYAVLIFCHLGMYTSSDDIFSLSYFNLAKTGAGVINASYIPWWPIIILFIISFIVSTLYMLAYKFSKKAKLVSFSPQIIPLSLSTTFLLLRTSAISIVEDEYSDTSIYKDLNGSEIIAFQSETQKKECLIKYGTMTYFIGEINELISPCYIDSDIPAFSNSLTSSEYSQNNLFKNYNVLTIMIETGCSFLVNEELTPNLYSLKSDSINFTNSYSKNKTNVSEFIGITGSGTSVTKIMSGSLENKYAITNVLNESGYTTKYFHDNDGSFYGRKEEMENLGFSETYFANRVNPEVIKNINKWNGSYPLDTEYVSLVVDDMIPEKSDTPFYSFYTTFSTHGPYARKGTEYQKFINLGYYNKLHEAEKKGTWVNPCLDDSEEIQNQIEYLECAMIDFDNALGLIINRLKETDQYDNTIIVLYGDHDAYYKSNGSNSLKEYVYNTNNYLDVKQYQIITLISNPTLAKTYRNMNNMKKSEIIYYNDFISPYIIVPTILDILGYDYNPNCYVGTSIFRTTSKFDNMFYSHELGFYMSTDLSATSSGVYGYDNNTTKEYKDEFEKQLQILIQKVYYFNVCYRYNTLK